MSAPDPLYSPEKLAELLDGAQVWKGHAHAALRADPTGHPGLDRLLPGGGWPRAALSEVLVDAPGCGEMQLVLPWIAALTQAGGRAALVRPPHLPYAPALAAAGVVLSRLCVITPAQAEGGHWAMEQMLRSGGFGTVLGWPGALDMRDLRRLQLAAETGGATGLLFRDTSVASQSTPAALRLRLHGPAERFEVEVLKSRGGRPGLRWRRAA